MLPSIYFLGPSFVATFTARAGLDIWLPVRPPTNMLGGARPGPRAIFYASCARTPTARMAYLSYGGSQTITVHQTIEASMPLRLEQRNRLSNNSV